MRRWSGFAATVTAAAFVACIGWSTPVPAAEMDPLADQILKAACNYLKSSAQFSFRSEATHEEVTEAGQKIQVSETHEVGVRRPDGVLAITRGDLGTQRLWFNGERLTILDLDDFTFSSVKTPDTIDAAFDYLAETYGIVPPLIDLLYSDPYGVLRPTIQSGDLIGRRWIRGVECLQLAFRGEMVDVQLWVENGLRPVIRKVVIDYKNEPSRPQYVAYLSEWNFSPRLVDNQFTFRPPPGAEEVHVPTLEEERAAEGK